MIPESGRLPEEGRGYPLQYSWVFPGGSAGKENICNEGDLGSITGLWEDPLEKGTTTHFSILAWRIPWTVQSMGSQSWTRLSNFHFHFQGNPIRRETANSSHKNAQHLF